MSTSPSGSEPNEVETPSALDDAVEDRAAEEAVDSTDREESADREDGTDREDSAEETPADIEAAAEDSEDGDAREDAGATDDDDSDDDDEGLGTQCEVENLGPCKLKITAEVPAQKVSQLLNKNYQDLISSLDLPGFRRGRVPRALVEKRYGKEVEKDLTEAILNDSFMEVVEQKKLKVVGRPKFGEVELEQDSAFAYEVEVEIRPEFSLGEYKGIEVVRETSGVVDKDVDEEIEALRSRHASLVPVEPSEAGPEDWFYASYRIFKDDEQVHEVANSQFRPDRGELDGLELEGLGEKIAARGESDTVSLQATLSDDYCASFQLDSELVGAEVRIELTIVDTKRVQLPDLDDEFAASLQTENLDDLRSKVRESLEQRSESQADRQVEDRVIEEIEKALEFDLPEGLIEGQKKAHKIRLQHQLIQLGKSVEEIEEALKKTEDETDEDGIRKELKRFFILDEIAEKEKIFATEDDITSRIRAMAEVYGKKPADIMAELERTGRFDEIRFDIRHEKVRRFLRERAKITGTPTNGSGKAADPKPETVQPSEQPSEDGAAAQSS